MSAVVSESVFEGSWSGKIYLGGTWVEPGGGTLAITDKASGETIAEMGTASAEDVARAATIAAKAQVEWAQTPGPERGDVVRRFAELIREHLEEIAQQMVRETGCILPKAQWEVGMTSRELLEASMLGSQPLGMMVATTERGRRSFGRRIPIGVIGMVTPWNSPVLLAARTIGPALAVGNAVILKPDPQTPVCGGVAFARILEEAGLPEGLFHVMPGGVPTGEAIVREPLVEMISFTGSTRGGRQVGALAGELLKRVSLELGGNNAYVVLPDVDIEAAATAGSWGSFFHQGQICLTAGRHIVHESIVKEYTERLIEHARKLAVGDPSGQVHLGPIINEKQAANVDRILKDSTADGAQVLVGGGRSGLYYEPTVVTNVRPGMPLFDEEIFGPVAPVIPFSTDEEAIELANQTHYGLVAAIVGRDVQRAQRIADRLRVGIVHINDQPVLHEVYGPIGGIGVSGNGYSYSTFTNADMFSEWQWVTSRDEIPEYPF